MYRNPLRKALLFIGAYLTVSITVGIVFVVKDIAPFKMGFVATAAFVWFVTWLINEDR